MQVFITSGHNLQLSKINLQFLHTVAIEPLKLYLAHEVHSLTILHLQYINKICTEQ